MLTNVVAYVQENNKSPKFCDTVLVMGDIDPDVIECLLSFNIKVFLAGTAAGPPDVVVPDAPSHKLLQLKNTKTIFEMYEGLEFSKQVLADPEVSKKYTDAWN